MSLYGLAAVMEIEELFFQQLHPVLSSKGMKLAGRVMKGALKFGLKIDIDGDGKPDGSVNTQIPDINIKDFVDGTDKCVLVFDDVERCLMPIEKLFGYINYFVEHLGLKVLLVANESEVKHSQDMPSKEYGVIKEKLVGRTFTVKPEVEIALPAFIEEIMDGDAKQVLLANIDCIKTCFDQSCSDNLRSLKSAVMDFERLFVSLPNFAKGNPEYLRHVLLLMLAFTFEHRSGSFSPSEINKINSSRLAKLFSAKREVKSDSETIIEKYPLVDFSELGMSVEAWESFFGNGFIDGEEASVSINLCKYFNPIKVPDWLELLNFSEMSDTAFETLLGVVREKYSERKYEDLGVVRHVTGLFLCLSRLGLMSSSVEEILRDACEYINYLEQNKSDVLVEVQKRGLMRNSYMGFVFIDHDTDKFKRFMSYIDDAQERVIHDKSVSWGREAVKKLTEDLDGFLKDIDVYENDNSTCARYPVLRYVDPKSFSEIMLDLLPSNRACVWSALERRYNNERHSDGGLFKKELEFIRGLDVHLSEYAEINKSKLSGFLLVQELDNFIQAINV